MRGVEPSMQHGGELTKYWIQPPPDTIKQRVEDPLPLLRNKQEKEVLEGLRGGNSGGKSK